MESSRSFRSQTTNLLHCLGAAACHFVRYRSAKLSDCSWLEPPLTKRVHSCLVEDRVTGALLHFDRCNIPSLRIHLPNQNSMTGDTTATCFIWIFRRHLVENDLHRDGVLERRRVRRNHLLRGKRRIPRNCDEKDKNELWQCWQCVPSYRPNENKMSDGGRGRASLGVEVSKSC